MCLLPFAELFGIWPPFRTMSLWGSMPAQELAFGLLQVYIGQKRYVLHGQLMVAQLSNKPVFWAQACRMRGLPAPFHARTQHSRRF